ncbi:hypothetical protein GOBAR_AA20671 [Gossypium barbadense]|uniref:DNA-directed RNA polymerase n=1 Tax=Gossypium barbadense TaxID=3634 RepID=A0A2P5X9J6_GOSBA|nr:hypothetical protein GOBAR_AA20671 [Gossypium barbadense]
MVREKGKVSTPTQTRQLNCVESRIDSKCLYYGRFILSPLMKGQTDTIGITRAKYEKIPHEYSTIERNNQLIGIGRPKDSSNVSFLGPMEFIGEDCEAFGTSSKLSALGCCFFEERIVRRLVLEFSLLDLHRKLTRCVTKNSKNSERRDVEKWAINATLPHVKPYKSHDLSQLGCVDHTGWANWVVWAT